jgi:hypothetical protein
MREDGTLPTKTNNQIVFAPKYNFGELPMSVWKIARVATRINPISF